MRHLLKKEADKVYAFRSSISKLTARIYFQEKTANQAFVMYFPSWASIFASHRPNKLILVVGSRPIGNASRKYANKTRNDCLSAFYLIGHVCYPDIQEQTPNNAFSYVTL